MFCFFTVSLFLTWRESCPEHFPGNLAIKILDAKVQTIE